ncbi:MAG: hypothetical protein JSR37_08590 [Verrucomicrobia bacterium]|nr:hypothetical protein [Verrucomicrobiota bacterium]MBS0636802.1 hypothetical protein [Verrucomicrobiota bacterium]
MSSMNVREVTLPANCEATLISFATAKEAKAPSILNEAMTLKIAFKDRAHQPVGDDVQHGIETLRKLREYCTRAVDAGKSAFATASVNDRRIAGIWFNTRFTASKESRSINAATEILKRHSNDMGALQKKFEAVDKDLKANQAKCEARAATLTLRELPGVSNDEFKAQLKPNLIWINGVRQESHEMLFTALMPGADKAKIETRAKTFSQPGIVPDLTGRDLDVLVFALPERFDTMSEALVKHLSQKAFKNNDGSQFFVGAENKEARKIVIEGEKVRHETEFELSRGGVVVATVKATATDDSSNCVYSDLKVKYGVARMPDYEKILRIFKEPAVAKVSETTV